MRALHRVLTDASLRERLRERGYQQVAKFSWEASVRRIVEAYAGTCHAERSVRDHQPAAD
jgi:glycosyltransferase involved in cell wall biosynthesis